jgi:RecA-family ATPase
MASVYEHIENGNGQQYKEQVADGPDRNPTGSGIPIMTCAELIRTYPERRPAVIDGLLREGETVNIIAAPKIGKSWLTLSLGFAIATGQPWLGFETTQGGVLIIDNELHRETSAHRLRTMANALNIPIEQIAGKIFIINLRGLLRDLVGLGDWLKQFPRGRFKLAVIDAFYRTLPLGADENSNASMAAQYNLVDHYGSDGRGLRTHPPRQQR